MTASPRLPAGYVTVEQGGARAVRAVVRAELADAMGAVLARGSLYEHAERHPGALRLTGRGSAYAIPLGEGTRVVVRRSRHGGVFAPLTGDRFFGATRAPRELATAMRLAECGIPTPDVVAYVTYPAGAFRRRADVATREISGGRDLATVLASAPDAATRRAALAAAARLIALLAAAGARHPDLNLKNVLIAPPSSESGDARGPVAFVLDVDRVWFDRPGAPRVARANWGRLMRSVAKWRRQHGLVLDESELRVRATGRAVDAPPVASDESPGTSDESAGADALPAADASRTD